MQTIRNTLQEAGLQSRKAAHKPALTDSQRQQRLDFALSHISWGEDEWNLVLFTDESAIQSYENLAVNVYRPRGSRYDPLYTRKRRRSGRVSLSVWSCMSRKGIGPLHRISRHFDGIMYCDLLEHVMIPEVLENHFSDGFFLFQQVILLQHVLTDNNMY